MHQRNFVRISFFAMGAGTGGCRVIQIIGNPSPVRDNVGVVPDVFFLLFVSFFINLRRLVIRFVLSFNKFLRFFIFGNLPTFRWWGKALFNSKLLQSRRKLAHSKLIG